MTNRGYLQWLFQGWYKDLTTWGFLAIVSSAVLKFLNPDQPYSFWIMITGGVVMLADLVWHWLKFSRSVYEMEQSRLWRELNSGNRHGNS